MLVEPTQLSIMPNLACVIAQNIVCLFEILNLIKEMFATDVFICQDYRIILVFQQFSLSLYIPENTGIFFTIHKHNYTSLYIYYIFYAVSWFLVLFHLFFFTGMELIHWVLVNSFLTFVLWLETRTHR